MIAASLYIVVCSARNRLRLRLRRLREPRYLLGAIAGAAYLYFSFFARLRTARTGRRRGAAAAPIALASAMRAGAPGLVGLALLAVAALAWILPFESGLLAFSEAETQFLFPAPVTRRALLLYRMIRSQIGLLFGGAILGIAMPSASGYARLRAAVAMWLLLSAGKVYFAGVSLPRVANRPHARALRARRGRLRLEGCHADAPKRRSPQHGPHCGDRRGADGGGDVGRTRRERRARGCGHVRARDDGVSDPDGAAGAARRHARGSAASRGAEDVARARAGGRAWRARVARRRADGCRVDLARVGGDPRGHERIRAGEARVAAVGRRGDRDRHARARLRAADDSQRGRAAVPGVGAARPAAAARARRDGAAADHARRDVAAADRERDPGRAGRRDRLVRAARVRRRGGARAGRARLRVNCRRGSAGRDRGAGPGLRAAGRYRSRTCRVTTAGAASTIKEF